MASETSEKTFVRCPSCRSLTLASAARCRICNNPLEGTAQAGEGDLSRAPSRVRQKTITASAEELMQAQAISESGMIAGVGVPSEPAQTGHEESSGEEVDPLSAYLQELEDEAAGSPTKAKPAAVVSNTDADVDAFLDGFEDVDPSPQPAEPAPIAGPPLRAEPLHHAGDVHGDDFDPLLGDDIDLEPKVSPVVEPPPPPPVRPPAPPRADPQPPPPPRAPQSGQQQTQPKQSIPPPPQNPQQRSPQQPPKQKTAAPVQEPRGGRESQKVQPNGGNNGERRDARDRQERRGDDTRKSQSNGGRPPERGGERHDRMNDRPEHATSGPKMGRMRPGRLFGWLVSFESPDGRAIELREGKFFVTGTSIRQTDLVIEDPSISTPHALMSINGEKGLQVQDLMSDRGIFVRSGERGQYRREDGPIELKHGDWIRFGDVEFLVTIVPNGR